MKFLYDGPPLRLENLCRTCHLTGEMMGGKPFEKLDARQRRRVSAMLYARRGGVSQGAKTMLDLILVATALAFFAVSIGYAYACDRL